MSIIILNGLPGTGKTTLANRLKEQLGYEYISDWEILKDFNIDSFCGDRISISEKLSINLISFILANKTKNLILDLDYSVMPNEMIEMKDDKYLTIYYLGFSGITKQKLIHAFKSKSCELNDLELVERIEYYLDISNFVKNECNRYNLDFVGIGEDREEKLDNLFNKICKNHIWTIVDDFLLQTIFLLW